MPILVTRGPSLERLDEASKRPTTITTNRGTFSVIPLKKEPDPTINQELLAPHRRGHQHLVTWMTVFGDKLIGSYDDLIGTALLDYVPFGTAAA